MHSHWLGTEPDILIPRLEKLTRDLQEVFRARRNPVRDAVVLEDYFLCQRAVPCLAGHMFGHPEIETGRPGFTSELFYLDPEQGIARTLSRWYVLGTAKEFAR